MPPRSPAGADAVDVFTEHAITLSELRSKHPTAPVALLLGDSDARLRLALVKASRTRGEASSTRAREFVRGSGHPAPLHASILQVDAVRHVAIAAFREDEWYAIDVLAEAIEVATAAIVAPGASGENVLFQLRWARNRGVRRAFVAHRDEPAAAMALSAGFAEQEIAAFDLSLGPALRCRCSASDCKKCVPWIALREALAAIEPVRRRSRHVLATTAVGYGVRAGDLLVNGAHTLDGARVGATLVLVLREGERIELPVRELTPGGAVFSAKNVRAGDVVGIVEPGTAAKAVESTEVVVVPPTSLREGRSAGQRIYSANAILADAGQPFAADHAFGFDFERKAERVRVTRPRQPFLIEPGGSIVLVATSLRGE